MRQDTPITLSADQFEGFCSASLLIVINENGDRVSVNFAERRENALAEKEFAFSIICGRLPVPRENAESSFIFSAPKGKVAMPPRRRGGNQRRGGGQQQANVPAVAEQEAAQPSLQRLLPNEVPLFQTGRNREQFWNAATEATYKQVPTAIVRNMNALAVNVWDACGRKKTNRPNFQLEPKIKERIWHFMGSTVEVGARHDPSLSRTAMIAIAEAKQQEKCDQILRNLAGVVRESAEKGDPMVFVAVSDVVSSTFGNLFGLTENHKHSTTAERSDWFYLCEWLKPLQPTLEAAGFKVDPSDPNQMMLIEDKNDPTKKIWHAKFGLFR